MERIRNVLYVWKFYNIPVGTQTYLESGLLDDLLFIKEEESI